MRLIKIKPLLTFLLFCMILHLGGCKPSDSKQSKPTIHSEKSSNQVIIDTSFLNDPSIFTDANDSFNHYPELLYLVQKDHPGAAYAAFKAAYIMAISDGNFYLEVENLVLWAYYTTSDDLSIWNKLTQDEKIILFSKLDELQPVDWGTEKQLYNKAGFCPIHNTQLKSHGGFYAQDGSAKPGRDLAPLLQNAETIYPFMTPWDFSRIHSETNPTEGRAQICPSCDQAVSEKLGSPYPEVD